MPKIPLFEPEKDRPRRIKTSIAIDEDILLWFRATGRGFQDRMNKALRWYIEQAEAEKRRRKDEDTRQR